MIEASKSSDAMAASVVTRPELTETLHVPGFSYVFECLDAAGDLKWREEFHNLVVTVGKNDMLDKYFAGSGYTATMFLGLKGTGTAVLADTLASHASWAELNPYTGNRPSIPWAAASGGAKSSSSAVSYAITGGATIAGGFIATVNTGTAGVLYSAGDFAAPRTVANGDTVNVTPTITITP